MTNFLDKKIFWEVVKNTPLVSIDLVLKNQNNNVLIGLRNNEPAKGFWFVPGGRIYKGERISEAFERITKGELGRSFSISDAKPMGFFEHIHDKNFAEIPGIGTHYIVLAYVIDFRESLNSFPQSQHSQYKWIDIKTAFNDNRVHEFTKTYFKFI